ncbi:MAG: barnase inhibitor [Bergeyella sp.]|nr:barnase inhibitor [Bergeyella sp.]
MKNVQIDFTCLGDYEDFYACLRENLPLPEYFGDNLDALCDVIEGELPLPLCLEFVNMQVEQLEAFEDLIATLEELSTEIEGFSFAYFLRTYE